MTMKTPELPKGYFFRVHYGEPYFSEFDYETVFPEDVIEIRRNRWWGGSSHVYSRKIKGTRRRSPATEKEIHSGMWAAKMAWEERLAENKKIEAVYGDYPPKTL